MGRSAAAAPPALWLAQSYPGGLDLQAYWVSEKYDGVRGYWDGQRLWTRQGEPIAAPAWFTAGWPATAMEGELWAGRGQFGHAQSTTRKLVPADADWRRMRFMVFDLPGHAGSFDKRLQALQALAAGLEQSWVQAAPQWKEASDDSLRQRLAALVKDGAEGLVLHKASAPYRSGRGDDVLKLKVHDDAEAQVIAYLPGKGKYEGLTGALLVRTPDGREFKLGSGLSDADRRQPPAIGTWVSYRYRGLHGSGLPRFATFWRVREGWQPPR
ncbi:DNA ligase [Comamonas humi]